MIASVILYLKKVIGKSKSKELVIFSRYPCPGTTKTRLIPDIGAESAAYAQMLMTEHILDNVGRYYETDNDVSTLLYFNGGTEKQMQYWLDRRKLDLKWQQQAKGGLGEKLSNVFKESFQRGSKYTVVIGSDIPGISSSIIAEAFTKLQGGKHMVLGPAADGGYYLIGLAGTANVELDKLFSDINWGTSTVFKEQSDKATSLGISLDILSSTLRDVDNVEDIPVIEEELDITKQQLTNPKLSVVIPVYNEAKNIKATLENILKNCRNREIIKEIIVSDGGSTDNTAHIVKEFATETEVRVKLIDSHPGRGFQQKEGASRSSGDILLFVHADTQLPCNYDDAILSCLHTPGNVAGYFRLSLDCLEDENRCEKLGCMFRLQMRWIRWTAFMKSKYLELPYGDQALFMSKNAYLKVGGFKEVYLMEDVMMVDSLRKIGHIEMASCGPTITSARRWEKYGAFRISGLNYILLMAYKCGIHPNKLAEWYYGDLLKKIQARSKQD